MSNHPSEEKYSDQHWHLTKSISVAHILSTVLIAGGLFMYGMSNHERLARIEQRQSVIENRMDRQINRSAGDLMLIRESIQRMEDRFERYMDLQVRPNGRSNQRDWQEQ